LLVFPLSIQTKVYGRRGWAFSCYKDGYLPVLCLFDYPFGSACPFAKATEGRQGFGLFRTAFVCFRLAQMSLFVGKNNGGASPIPTIIPWG